MLTIKGHYFSGETSKPQLARMEVIDDLNARLIIDGDGLTRETVQQINPKAIRISSRLGNTPRQIQLSETEVFSSTDHQNIEDLSVLLSGKNASKLHKLESNSLIILFSLIFTVAFIVSTYLYGIPKASEIIVNWFPEISSERFDDSLSILDEAWLEPTNLSSEKQDELLAVFEPYLEKHKHLKPRINFRSGIGPNALALPSGDIVFTDEIVHLAGNDEELIAILFHELGHLEHKHIAKRAVQSGLMTIIALLMIGDINSVDMLAGLPALLLDLSYSRDFEREADLFSLQELHEFSISKEHFISIMHKLRDYTPPSDGNDLEDDNSHKDNNDQEIERQGNNHSEYEEPTFLKYLSTHPDTNERIKMIEDYRE